MEIIGCDSSCVAVISISGCVVLVLAVMIGVYAATGWWGGIQRKGAGGGGSGGYSTDILLPLQPIEVPPMQEPPTNLEIDPKWEIPRSRITILECLGEGEFGRVLKATAKDLPSHPGTIIVAVKTLKEKADSSELSDLISEYELLKEVQHPNIIRLLGACTSQGGPVYIIMEYCALGSLRGYLRSYKNIRHNKTKSADMSLQAPLPEVSPRDILSFCWQICKGMAYLTDIKLVHRDLAARNILLAEGKMCKISDFGLTRDVYVDDTYLKKSRGRVPVKWMALESLSDHIYTSKSDVWSFGIVLWEMVTLGSSPYPGVPAQNLYNLLKTGHRMQRPSNCSRELYQIMKDCWAADPSHRPSFNSLARKFERLLEDGSDYLDCNIHAVDNPAYFGDPNHDPPQQSTSTQNGPFDIQFQMNLTTEDHDEDEDVEDAQTEPKSEPYINEMFAQHMTKYDTPKHVSNTQVVCNDTEQADEVTESAPSSSRVGLYDPSTSIS